MRNPEYFKGKKVVIVGLARSGMAAANLLYDLGAKVGVTDLKDDEAVRKNAGLLKSKEIELELGVHKPEFIRGAQMLVISPGVTNASFPVVWAIEAGIPVISEIELAWMLCSAKIVAVTGSGGKTTVTTLIGKIIEASGSKVFTCGNIGNPFSGEVQKMKPQDYVSLELSSFQLGMIRDFRPKVAVMLNFSRNHLDWHKDMQEYLDAKKRIFLNQQADDFLVLNELDPVIKAMAGESRAKVAYFSQSPGVNPNQAAVLAVASVLGIDKAVCEKVFSEFKPLPHRMEYVAEFGKVRFINDSKATLMESTVWAIKNIPSPVILIAGGKDKGVDYSGIIESGRDKVKAVVLIGQAKDKIRASLAGAFTIAEAATLEEAVHLAYRRAAPGDCVLLSPMCSSFDMFSNYEERGEIFKKAVLQLGREIK